MRLQLAPEFISAAYCCYTHVRNIKRSRKTMRPQGYLTLYLVILLFSVIAISSAQNGKFRKYSNCPEILCTVNTFLFSIRYYSILRKQKNKYTVYFKEKINLDISTMCVHLIYTYIFLLVSIRGNYKYFLKNFAHIG